MSSEQINVKYDDKEFKVTIGWTINQFIKEHLGLKDIITAKIDGLLCDLTTAMSSDCTLDLFSFNTPEGKEVFWHSSAHILGNALCNVFKCKLVNGPPIEEGFYYDIDVDTPISTEHFETIEKEMMKIVKSGVKFEKETVSKSDLLKMYEDNEYKKYFVNKFVENESTIYKNAQFFDMCQGPHLNNTGYVKAIKLLKTSSAYFLNDSTKPSLQRIYGISFPSKELMKEYLDRLERAKEMDHRKIGKEMDLFFFHKYSAGSCFWLPEGAHIYNKLMEFMRGEYRKRGFKEVITPNIFSVDLWKESGHYDNYKENIYMVEKEDFALKPMNCPGHCLIFRNTERSFKELPLRLADFGVLHRNEISGALSGLTRVRRFQQDDAHIFCMREQIKSEISGCLDFLKFVYSVFGFKYELFLSTRPEKFLGEISEWDEAENALKNAIVESDLTYKLNQGDGAFYGPKIDIILQDAHGRKIQCATIQLDFQLPQRFGLKYTSSEGTSKTPVIIHRAICGSLERMIAILIESYGKELPFWLSPRQVALVPLYADEYAHSIKEKLSSFEVKVYDDAGCTLNKRIRNAEIDGFKLVCVVGKKEEEKNELNVRYAGKNSNYPLEGFIKMLNQMVEQKCEFGNVLDISKCSL